MALSVRWTRTHPIEMTQGVSPLTMLCVYL